MFAHVRCCSFFHRRQNKNAEESRQRAFLSFSFQLVKFRFLVVLCDRRMNRKWMIRHHFTLNLMWLHFCLISFSSQLFFGLNLMAQEQILTRKQIIFIIIFVLFILLLHLFRMRTVFRVCFNLHVPETSSVTAVRFSCGSSLFGWLVGQMQQTFGEVMEYDV